MYKKAKKKLPLKVCLYIRITTSDELFDWLICTVKTINRLIFFDILYSPLNQSSALLSGKLCVISCWNICIWLHEFTICICKHRPGKVLPFVLFNIFFSFLIHQISFRGHYGGAPLYCALCGTLFRSLDLMALQYCSGWSCFFTRISVTYAKHAHNICATYAKHARNMCLTYAKHARNICIACV